MELLQKVVRVSFLYATFFIVASLIAAIWLGSWPAIAFTLFVFGAPAILVWALERRRSAHHPSKNHTPKQTAQPIKRERKRHIPSPEQSGGKWIPAHGTVSIAGRTIDGMVYVGTPPSLNDYYGWEEKSRPYIDPTLPVAPPGSVRNVVPMPYWPGYSDVSKENRAIYLDWLAGGRTNTDIDPGYVFLFFYGLERRLFLDNPSQEEKQQILAEAQRLADLFSDSGSVRRYFGELIEVAKSSTVESDQIPPIFENSGWELPLSLKIAIGAQLLQGDRLNADWVLSWFMCHPERNLRTAANRCREEFMTLFQIRFRERYPDGLKINKPRKLLKATYRAASGEFEGSINPSINGAPIPDISGLRKPVEIAQEIADHTMDDLDKFSRFLGRNPDARGSIEAHALLPLELWEFFPSEELEELRSWARTIVDGDGFVGVADVVERLEGDHPSKVGKRQLTGAADALARLGFGLAPDPRFALRSPKVNEIVVLFELGARIDKLEDVSSEYKDALIELALGSFIAHADDHIAEQERTMLAERIGSTDGLNDQEQRRLSANLKWLLAVPPDITLLRRKLKDVGADRQDTMRAALVAAAHADGMIQSQEVIRIEKVYKALGLDPSLAYSDLHAGTKVVDAPPTVRPAQTGASGEEIPPPESSPSKPRLDPSRIATIRSDTQRVSSVLGQIFGSEEDEDDAEAHSTDKQSVLPGLHDKHAALVSDLVAQDHWTDDAFDELCRQHELLAAGALEVINEWAFENHDDSLLDEYEGYDVNPEVADAVKAKLNRESSDVKTETA